MQEDIYMYHNDDDRDCIRVKSIASAHMFSDAEISQGMFVYKCNLDQWFPVPRASRNIRRPGHMTSDANRLYLIEEFSNLSSGSCGVKAYDHQSGKWQTLPRTPCTSIHAACAHQGRIYVVGDSRVCGGKYTNNLDVYDPVAGRRQKLNSNVYFEPNCDVIRLLPYGSKLQMIYTNNCEIHVGTFNELGTLETCSDSSLQGDIFVNRELDLYSSNAFVMECVVF
jgi:hypothetical protein